MRRRCACSLAAVAVLGGCGSTKTVTHYTAPPPCKTDEVPTEGGECVPAVSVHAPGQEGSGVKPEGSKPQAPPKNLPPLEAGAKHISQTGGGFIGGFEGFSSCPYWDPYGSVWTRGFGETEGIGRGSPCITRAYGVSHLNQLIVGRYEWGLRSIGVPFNQNQWDALCSFAYNLGAGIFTGSLRESLRHYNPGPLLAYTHAGGQVLPGLVRRRNAEVALFRKPAGPPPPPACDKNCKKRQLYAAYGVRNDLRTKLVRYDCRRRKARHEQLGPKCTDWFAKGDAVGRRIAQLHREGIF